MLPSGTRLGPFVVGALIGEGAMGEVYRAHDSRLKRDVALKLLPFAFASDADRVARFEREAQVLASLNHPYIAAIYGVEDAGDTRALVMEMVEGPTLADRLADGPIAPDEGIVIARQIAEALEAAHDAGIIHRDLKPANVKVRHDGTVKVLDFGLAKLSSTGAGSATGAAAVSPAIAPTLTGPAVTQGGIILGSAAYMSPEQARGRAVDRRTDIWAFGCVLYEMLTGVRAFPGDNITDVLASVVRNEPDFAALPAATPGHVRRLLSRCLEKDPKRRLRDIGEARLALERPDDELPAGPATSQQAHAGRLRWATVAAAVGMLAIGIALGVAWSGTRRFDVSAAPPMRLAITFPQGAEMHLGLPRPSLAVSPDGRKIVYTAAGGPEAPQLWVRDLNEFTPTPIPGTRNARMATFSPDGRWVAFFADNKLKKVPITTGPPVALSDAAGALGATWTAKDEIVFALGLSVRQETGLWVVPAAGGERRKLASGSLWFPDALPNGNAVLATMNNPAAATSSDLTIVAVDLQSGSVTPLVEGGTYARYVTTGHLVFLRNGALMAAPFDPATMALSEERVPVVEGVYLDPSLPGGNYALSATGTLAYAPGDGSHFRRTLATAAAGGGLRPLIEERRFYQGARLSPDAKRVAVLLRAWHDTLWTLDIARVTFTRISTGDQSVISAPTWSRDGTSLVFSVLGDDGSVNLFHAASDGSGQEERLATSEYPQTPHSFSLDGRTLVFSEQRPATGSDLLLLSMDDRTVRPLLATRFSESAAAVSPDGRWIAYQSDRSGEAQVYVAAFPAMTSVVQASSDGGTNPVWSSDGRELYYNRGYFAANIEVVDVAAGPALTLSKPRLVGQFSTAAGIFDVLPDGRILFVTGTGQDGSIPELRLVVNWVNELKQKLGSR